MIKRFGLALLVCLLFAVCAYGQTEKLTTASGNAWSIDTSVGMFTDYMWRGFKLYDGLSIQPSATVGFDTGLGEVSADAWIHLPGDTGRKQSKHFTEFDGTLRYEYQLEPVTLSAGHIWYTYSDYGDGGEIPNSNEIFGSLAVGTVLSPTVTVYRDYREYDNTYFELSFSHEFGEALGKETSITPSLTFGFASQADKVYEQDGLELLNLSVAAVIPFGPMYLSPSLDYTFKVDELTLNQFCGGIVLGYSFE